MIWRFFLLTIAVCATPFAGAAARTSVAPKAIEAKQAFENRQDDLISLAGYFGTLHRLHRLCGTGYSPNLFRIRMRELVPLESPMGRTRLDMITAFNQAYRDTSALHSICSPEAKTAYTKTAERALIVTNRLYAPFRR